MYYGKKKVSQKPQYTNKEKAVKEQSLQSFAEALCNRLGLQYIHIPDTVYRLCAPLSKLPIHRKKELADAFKGVPDLLIFGNDLTGELFSQCLILELKRVGKSKRPNQVAWCKGLIHHVPQAKDEIEEIIMKFYEHCNGERK